MVTISWRKTNGSIRTTGLSNGGAAKQLGTVSYSGSSLISGKLTDLGYINKIKITVDGLRGTGFVENDDYSLYDYHVRIKIKDKEYSSEKIRVKFGYQSGVGTLHTKTFEINETIILSGSDSIWDSVSIWAQKITSSASGGEAYAFHNDSNQRMTVTYEGTEGLFKYNTGNGWQNCSVNYYDGAKWVQVQPHYYENGLWKPTGA